MIDDKKWAIQDESGDWWLISGSEFPEKKRNSRYYKNKREFIFHFNFLKNFFPINLRRFHLERKDPFFLGVFFFSIGDGL